MEIERIVVGPIETNCYIVSDTECHEAVVIDPGFEEDLIINYLKEKELNVQYILNTHGHFDHIQANDALRDFTDAPLAIHADDVELLTAPEKVSMGMMRDVHGSKKPEIILHNADRIAFGRYELQVIYTPGHSKGGCCFYEEHEKVCFTGDTLFRGGVGRTDLYGGNTGVLLKSVRERLQVLTDDTKVYPGHGPSSDMGFERKVNPYLR